MIPGVIQIHDSGVTENVQNWPELPLRKVWYVKLMVSINKSSIFISTCY